MIKLKDFKECDLIIVGYNAGEVNTQFEKGIGSYLWRRQRQEKH
jgi:hypothetical protein